MLPRFLLRAAICLTCVFTAAMIHAQEERVPSGDLSDFFNPPGVKSEGINSTTRTFGSSKKKKDATTSTTKKVEAPKPDDSTTDKPAAKSKSTAPTPTPVQPTPGAGERVKIESSEMVAIEGGISFGRPTTTNWRVGVVMLAGSSTVKNVICRIPVPVQWPEQTVSVHEEDLPAEITDVSWEDLGNIRFMKFRIEDVPPGEKLIATVTFRVATSQIKAPENTSIFRVSKERTREIKPYFGESPEISMRNTKLKKQAKLLFDNTQSDWARVEGIFDWVRDNVEERSGEPKGSVKTFLDMSGTGEDRVGLFVAMCRINKVPARMVFVDGTQYAEFYLVDDKGQGHWFPCKVTGIREFGSIGEPKVILQKGDNYRVPGEKKKLKFVPAKGTVKGSRPRILKFVREPLSVN